MNLPRLAKAIAALCLLSLTAVAEQPAVCPTPDQEAPRTQASSAPPPATAPGEAAPVVRPQEIAVEPPQNLAAAYACSAPPPVGDPIKVRRNFAPEMRDSVLNVP